MRAGSNRLRIIWFGKKAEHKLKLPNSIEINVQYIACRRYNSNYDYLSEITSLNTNAC